MKKEFNEIYNVLTESWYEGMEYMKPNERIQSAITQMHHVSILMREIGEAEFLKSSWVRYALAEASVEEVKRIYKLNIYKIEEHPEYPNAKQFIDRLEDEYLHVLAELKPYSR